MEKKEKSDEEVSLAELAKTALDRIVKLSQSQIISEKLQSLNILLFVFILTVIVTYYLGGVSTKDLSLLVLVAMSFVLALLVSPVYGSILAVVSNVSSNKIKSLRIGINMLFIALTLAVGALTFDVKLLAIASLALIGFQILIIPLSSFLLPKISVEDKNIEASQLWTALGRIASMVGIVSFIIDMILFLLKVS